LVDSIFRPLPIARWGPIRQMNAVFTALKAGERARTSLNLRASSVEWAQLRHGLLAVEVRISLPYAALHAKIIFSNKLFGLIATRRGAVIRNFSEGGSLSYTMPQK